MIFISWALIAVLNAAAMPPTVEFIDSNDNPKKTYLVINHDNKTCKLLINKSELKDYDKILAVAMEKCGL